MKTPEQWLAGEFAGIGQQHERSYMLDVIRAIQKDAYDDGVNTMYEIAHANLVYDGLINPDT